MGRFRIISVRPGARGREGFKLRHASLGALMQPLGVTLEAICQPYMIVESVM